MQPHAPKGQVKLIKVIKKGEKNGGECEGMWHKRIKQQTNKQNKT